MSKSIIVKKTVSTAGLARLTAQLRRSSDSARPLVVDLRLASAPGLEMIQVLLAAMNSGSAFVLKDPSPDFVSGWSRFGLFGELMTMPMMEADSCAS